MERIALFEVQIVMRANPLNTKKELWQPPKLMIVRVLLYRSDKT